MHNLLKRQLTRLKITEEQLPTMVQWEELLIRIDHSYTEADQERYLLERSMDISSREMCQLNEKLEQAQHIAHLGYWQYDLGNKKNKKNKKMLWSNEMYLLFGLKTESSLPLYDAMIDAFDAAEKNILEGLIKHSLQTGEKFELEAKINSYDGQIRWCYLSGEPSRSNEPIRQLTGITLDITSRKKAELELHELNKQFIASARRAGMSEVAVSVLHNVGNILNSVNISIELIQKSLQQSEIQTILKATKMLNQHRDHLSEFLSDDPKGKLLPDYFFEAEKSLQEEVILINKEIVRLNESIKHLKDIVAIQNSISGIPGIFEKTSITEILDAAIDLSHDSLKKRDIHIEKKYSNHQKIETDKNKIMQIIVNLIQNAKDALLSSDPSQEKKITISSQLDTKNENIEIIISDTGIGITQENLIKIFNFGFTTKAHGHGFGLHSSALLAKELGGSLHAESKGLGQGARFILTLSVKPHMERRKAYA